MGVGCNLETIEGNYQNLKFHSILNVLDTQYVLRPRYRARAIV